MSAKTVDIVIVILNINSSVITDWLETSNFNESLTSFFIIKFHNSALIKLYLINILHDE